MNFAVSVWQCHAVCVLGSVAREILPVWQFSVCQADTLKPHGSGSMLFADGCSFDGNWQNGLRYGTGVLTIPSAILDETCSRSGISSGGCDSQREGSNFNIKEGYVVVEGMWEDDTPSAAAEWTISFPCGDKYLGHLGIWPPKDTFSAISKNTGPLQRDSNDNDNEGKVLPHGRGLCKHKSTGEVYDGEWKEGMRHGQGVRYSIRSIVLFNITCLTHEGLSKYKSFCLSFYKEPGPFFAGKH